MEVPLLKCYLAKAGNEKHQMLLFPSKLMVVFKGEQSVFDYNLIHSLSIGQKKLIIALVLGGIGTSFSMLALSLGWYHYQLNLLTVFFFFGWMYYGFLGKDAVMVNEKGHQSVFLINANKAITSEFLNFTKERMWKVKTPFEETIFHLVEKQAWESQLLSYHYAHLSLKSEGFIHCSTYEQLAETYVRYFSKSSDLVLLTINPKWVLSELKWEESTERASFFPHVYGPLNKSSILNAYTFDTNHRVFKESNQIEG